MLPVFESGDHRCRGTVGIMVGDWATVSGAGAGITAVNGEVEVDTEGAGGGVEPEAGTETETGFVSDIVINI
ncbi:hypothetical protein BOTCAL_0262g00140 [Botryotinia calthae]|uniref:Uncharacterized protein n=1 Tax=Botryotinia calthae TaxID=38488 RepID=A0A4Y8CYW5_9HELO|nr:hypothetical protein BOTCAL_0262g00140 [Botryotinia calthae]